MSSRLAEWANRHDFQPMKAQHNVHRRLGKIRHWLLLDKLPPTVRKVVVSFAGAALIVGGVVLIILPIVPGFFLIPLGVFLLASEFKWAEYWAQKMVDAVDKARRKWRERKAGAPPM